ncbi:MAG: class I SAM-dependent methyltransferase family protein [Candidatus Heimdallarchaeota archaeon]|nr:MAG: class I SAM-dependent methyltransferase family protein [Candidatus Heimdallarchaeota archaeon]
MTSKRTPFQQIKQTIQDQKILPAHLISLLPKRWKRVGKVGILNLNPELLPWKREIGEKYLEFLPELKTVAHKVGITTTTTRQPDNEVLAGEPNTVTLHKELGCKFWIDALNLTFSNGNHAERQRMIKNCQEPEQIIDMFACVGNLSLPIAVHNPTVKIIGIEINPDAFMFLEKNIQENQVKEQYQAVLGDNRKLTPKDWANRVLMGYFTIDNVQFKIALASLRQERGGIIHAHGLSSSRKPTDWRPQIQTVIEESFPHLTIKTSNTRTIKTVAPGINHYVNDLEIQTTTSNN